MRTYTKEELQDIAENGLHAACSSMQDAIGQKHGDIAAMFFTGSAEDEIHAAFMDYLKCELTFMEGDKQMDISILTTSYVDLDDLIEEHGEAKAQVLFEQFRSTPPDGEPDKEFAQSIVDRLPKGEAVLTRVEWALENPDSDTALEWCQHYHFDFPIIKSKGMLEVGSNHYYAHVYGDENGGETWKHQGDAIEYFAQMIKGMETAA